MMLLGNLINKTHSLFIFVILHFTTITFSQTITGNLNQYLNEIIDAIPTAFNNDYLSPTNDQLNTWESMIESLIDEDFSVARIEAELLNYKIVEFNNVDSFNGTYYILEEKNPRKNYWGTYVFNFNACRNNLVIQAPHPVFDTNTGREAIHCFLNGDAFGLFISGAHRCNHSQSSPCNGTTSVCGNGIEKYKITDLAHNTLSVFQVTTTVISEQKPSSTFIQLHGFAQQSTDPFLILSNGTRIQPDPDPIEIFADNIQNIDNRLTSKIGHLDLAWDRLLAFTNTQGRMLNESVDACYQNANSGTGRFIHIEQEFSLLRKDSIGWQKMSRAINETFSCLPSSIAEKETRRDITFSPNPVYNNLKIESPNYPSYDISIFNSMSQKVLTFKSSNYYENVDVAHLESGIYFILVHTNTSQSIYKVIKM